MRDSPPETPTRKPPFILGWLKVSDIGHSIVVCHIGREAAYLDRNNTDTWYDKLIAAGYTEPEAMDILHEIA